MNNIQQYFEGEQLQSTIGIIISIIFISVSVYFLFLQKPALKGVSYSFIPLSFLLLAVCTAVIIRTPTDIERVTSFYQTDPQKIQTDELPRMEKVMKNFTVIKKVEIGFFIAGLLLAVFFWRNDLIKGIAIGLMVQSVVLYLFDLSASARAKIYVEFLESI